MSIDKNKAIIEYLSSCPIIANNKLFFNFAEEGNNSNQILISGDDVALNKPFIDGSVMKRYTFTLFIYKAISYNPVVKAPGYPDENVGDLSDVQALLDWIVQQNEQLLFPNFGDECIIESVEPQTNKPVLNGVSVDAQPPLAQYSIIVRITYLDKSKMIWS